MVGATVLLACGWMAVLAGTASAAPGVPSVSHTVACAVGGGHVEVTVANDGESGDDPLQVEIHDRDPDIIAWEGQVLPGASHTEGFDGVEDGVSTYLVVVDDESTQVIVPVDCSDPSLGSVAVDCATASATLQLANAGTNPSVITVLADGEPVDTVTVGPGGSAQVVVPLVVGHATTVVVVGDGEQVASRELALDCVTATTPTTSVAVLGAGQTGNAAGAVSPAGELPYTGTDSLPASLLGASLVVGGGLLALAARRRRT